jgi:D-sedoheptulose 7-phosphate isomerase
LHNQILKRIDAARDLIANDLSFPTAEIDALAQKILVAFKNGNKVGFVGNGGSAAEAMHLAAEFTGKCVVPHAAMPAICLNESQSALTAIANDFGVEEMFARQVEAHLGEGDILIALSTSGKSPNILNAVKSGIQKNVDCYMWTGLTDFKIIGARYWEVPSSSIPRIQEIHLIWGHILAEVVELQLQ